MAKFGNGTDGDLSVTGTTTINTVIGLVDSNASSGATSLVLTADAAGLGFAAGNCILIHQTKHSTDPASYAGKYQENYIVSVSGTTINLLYPLNNNYYGDTTKTVTTDHPDITSPQTVYTTACQVIKIPRYSSITIGNGGILQGSTWNRNTGKGGILKVKVSGLLDIQSGGKIFMAGKGLSNGTRGNRRGWPTEVYYDAQSGEDRMTGWTQNANTQDIGGGCGGKNDWGNGGGGGAGNNSAGADGDNSPNSGAEVVPPDGNMSSAINIGGGGGGGGTRDAEGVTGLGGFGGRGGGIIIVEAKTLKMAGNIDAYGADGTDTDIGAGGGGGGSGPVLIDCISFIYTAGTIRTFGGTKGTGKERDGGNGGNAKIQINACSISGSIASSGGTKTESVGGKNWCGSVAAIIH